MDFDKCTVCTTESKIVLKERKSTFEIENSNNIEVKKIQVDGCLIPDQYEKCDWIIELKNPVQKAFFIELKGCKLAKAISQLISTLLLTNETYANHKKECFIVTTRVPRTSPEIQRKRKELYKHTGTTLIVKNRKYTIKI